MMMTMMMIIMIVMVIVIVMIMVVMRMMVMMLITGYDAEQDLDEHEYNDDHEDGQHQTRFLKMVRQHCSR